MLQVRILLIEDEPRWLEFAKNSLPGFEIIAVSDTDEAVKALSESQIDLVIASSLQLPDLKKIRQEYGDKPLFIISSEPTRGEARSAYLIGAKRYIPKTFDADNLREEIANVVSVAS
jgi:DNA-binding response OmpR family regulator